MTKEDRPWICPRGHKNNIDEFMCEICFITRGETNCAPVRTKPVKALKRTPLSRVSPKRAEANLEYSGLRNEYLAAHPICECCGESPSTEIHHKRGRENERLTEAQYFLAVCRTCHRLITEDSEWAIREGYSLPRNQKEVNS